MQTRFWIASYKTYEAAKAAKTKLQEENPDNNYQIRAGKERGEDVFRVVQRLQSNEATVVHEIRRPKSRKRREVDTSWIKHR
jgi:2-C-methyl-D-erythritol 4-phosphate cytidylyltransferase